MGMSVRMVTATAAAMRMAVPVRRRVRRRLMGRESMRVRRGRRNVTRVHHLPYFLVLVVQRVRQLRLLEAGRRHPLVHCARRWVRGVEARLNQLLSRLGCDHRLELPRRKRVDMSRLTGHQKHHLGPSQC
jgi:hypothetical protein